MCGSKKMMETFLAARHRVGNGVLRLLGSVFLPPEQLDVFDSDFNDTEGEDNEVFDEEGVDKQRRPAKRAPVRLIKS